MIGIDISKKTLDVTILHQDTFTHFKTTNDLTGFHKIIDIAKDNNYYITCEATGRLWRPLADFAIQNEVKISVVNPLKIKRFMQMKGNDVKTDKKDACLIALYASQEKPNFFTGSETEKLKAMQKLAEHYKKLIVQNQNKIEALKQEKELEEIILDLKSLNEVLRKKLNALKHKIKLYLNLHFKQEKKILKSIPGIADETISIICGFLNCFKGFDCVNQVLCYIGTNLKIEESGTSVKKKKHITKKGNFLIRKMFYMGSLSAMRYNTQCKALSERLKAKHKHFNLIMIATANKLIKQAFYCIKNGVMYDSTK